MTQFVHLRMHSGFSMKDGIIQIPAALEKAKADGMPALAITDLNNVMGGVQFYEAARKTGVKPLLGVDVNVERPDQDEKHPRPEYRLTFLVKNQQGYQNLNRLLGRAYVENNKKENPLIKREWLADMPTEGLIVLSGATEGRVGECLAQGEVDLAKAEVEWMKAIFKNDDYVLELQRDGRVGQEAYVAQAVELAAATDTLTVATHMNQFMSPEDFDAHDTRVAIAEDKKLDNPERVLNFTREQYFKSTEEMQELFKDIPEALSNSVEIAKRCNLTMNLGHPELPRFETPNGESESDHLNALARSGLEKRLTSLYPNEQERSAQRPAYEARLELELSVIKNMGFPGYFLIVQDFINWAKSKDIPVGPGRGSGAGSLVAYSIRITDIDPLKYDLLFERFLNPERVSLPDFDIDFCRNRRDEVIDYVRNRYGANNVSQIATTGTMASKMVVKDVARVMGLSPFQAQDLADLIPKDGAVPVSLKRALEESPKLKELYDTEPEVKALFKRALKLEGTPRGFGTHAGGVLIAPRDLSNFTPLYYEGKGMTSHHDHHDMEKLGLVKFDFLGIDTLTSVKKAVDMIRALPGQESFDIEKINIDDPKTFELFRKANTWGVFQVEKEQMSRTVAQMLPSNFADIYNAIALYRPGPLNSGMVDEFILRKTGQKDVDYLHPKLEEVLKPTLGVIVYQEQVMKIAQVLAGYSLGGADILRKAMGKKNMEEMAKQRSIFTEGAVARGVEKDTATHIFNLMEQFAEYGFNKSHSVAYGWLSYQTAYLKAHFPQQFYAATLTCDAEQGKFKEIAATVKDARKNGIEILPPDVNKSRYEFVPEGDKAIRFGFSGIKGVGEPVAMVLQHERKNGGDFNGFFEFGRRLGKGTVNARAKDALINAGAFDSFGHSRETLSTNLKTLQDYIDKLSKEKTKALSGRSATEKEEKAGIVEGNLMGELFQDDEEMDSKKGQKIEPFVSKIGEPEMVEAKEPWTMLERLDKEFSAFEFYFTGHPCEAYRKEFGGMRGVDELESLLPGDHPQHIAGLVLKIFERKAKTSGNPWGSVVLSDGHHEVDVTLFGDAYQAAKNKLKEGKWVMIGGQTKPEMFQNKVQFNAEHVYTADEARTVCTEFLQIAAKNVDTDLVLQEKIKSILDSAPVYENGFGSRVILYASRDEGGPAQKTRLAEAYHVVITKDVMNELKNAGAQVKLRPYAEVAPPIMPEKKFFKKPRRN
jgi:DNA polymerase III subunit alpha